MPALSYTVSFFLYQVMKAAVVRILTTVAVMKNLEIMMHFPAPVVLLKE